MATRSAARLLPILDDPRALDRYIAASQVGITLSSLVLGAYAQAILAPRAAPVLIRLSGLEPTTALSVAAAAILVALTVLSVILGELVPKAVALQYPTQTALFTVAPMRWSLRVYAWLIDILNGSAILILRLLRVPNTGHRHVHSPEEIELLIAESRDGGMLEPREQVRLHRALRLGLRNAGQLMVPPRSACGDRHRDAAGRRAAASPRRARTAACRCIAGRSTRSSESCRPRTSCCSSWSAAARERSPNSSARCRVSPTACRRTGCSPSSRDRRSHQAIVVDADGRVAGLITLEDVLGELLGTVPDEFKAPRLLPIRLTDGRVRLPGAAPARARPHLGGGRLAGQRRDRRRVRRTGEAGAVPEPGARLEVLDLPVEIESVEGHTIASVIVTPPCSEDEADGERE